MRSSDVDWNPNWRDRYHVDDLDKVLDILDTQNRQWSNVSAVNQWPNTSGLAGVHRDHPILNKPLPSLPSASDGTSSLEPSPSSFISWTSTNSSHTLGASSHTTSSTDTTQASASSTSPYSGIRTSSVVSRRACSKDSKATQQDVTLDLRRHLNKPLPLSPSKSDGTVSLEPSPNIFMSPMSWTPTNSSHTAGASSYTSSPTNTSQASTSPTSPYPGTPTTPAIRCRACSLTFSGTPQDAMSNYRRHIRTSRRHNRKAGVKCPMPECAKNSPMRSDNLKGHLQNKHKMNSDVERQRYIDMAKESAMAADSHVRSRRTSRRDSTTDSMTLIDEGDDDVFMN